MINLIILTVYNETVQVKIVDIQDTSLTLSWSAANENAKALGNFQGYQVIGSSNGSEFYTKDLTGNITSLTVENLTSCTEFVFTVRVFSLVVYGKRSAPVSKTTMCDGSYDLSYVFQYASFCHLTYFSMIIPIKYFNLYLTSFLLNTMLTVWTETLPPS